MRKLILIASLLFLPQANQSQSLAETLIENYAKFIYSEEKTEVYEATIEYMSGRKTFNTLSNYITSYNWVDPVLGIDYKAPEVEGIRLLDGNVWIGTKKAKLKDIVKTLSVHRKTIYNQDDAIVFDTIYSESPSPPSKLMQFVNHKDVEAPELDAIPYVSTKAANNITTARPIPDVIALDKIPYVTTTAIDRMRTYAETWVNPDAEKAVINEAENIVWIEQGANWSITNSIAYCDGSQARRNSVYGDIGLELNKNYTVTITVSEIVSGGIKVYLGGHVVGEEITTAGTYTQTFYIDFMYDPNIWVQGTLAFKGSVDVGSIIVNELN